MKICKILITCVFISLFFASCQISGLTSGYSHLSKSEQSRVVSCKGNIASIQDYSKVYTVTAEQVKEFIATHEKVLIYCYTPYCKSSDCISPKKLLDICNAQKVELLVIANIYDDIFLAVNSDFPILMIDTKAYNTERRSKYIDCFYKDLIGRQLKEINYASYHYFSNNAYVNSYQNIENTKLY